MPPEIFHVGSLNRLLDIIGTVAGRQVGPETAEAGQKCWQDWEAVQRALCLEEEKLLVTLGARAKALLLWMQGSAAGRRIASFQAVSSAVNLRPCHIVQQIACIPTVSAFEVSLPLSPTAATSHTAKHTLGNNVTVIKFCKHSPTHMMPTNLHNRCGCGCNFA